MAAGTCVRHPKVCVYAIALNEVKNVDAFMDHCQGADLVSVADTGSTDGTVEALEARGAAVFRVGIRPFRFDTARNAALALLPADCDLCIGIDLDDQLQPGWLDAIRKEWASSADKPQAMEFKYVWRFLEDGVTPNGDFMATKIHSRWNWTWRHPAHEALYWVGDGDVLTATPPGLEVHHRPHVAETCRGACRASYVRLLKLGVDEDPHDARRSYYYGRELYFAGHHEDAVIELERYLALPAAVWLEERATALRHIADCHAAQGRMPEALEAARRGAREWGATREPWMAVARLAHRMREWGECRDAAARVLGITQRSAAFGNDAASWGWEPHDLLALCSYYLGDGATALEHGLKAAELAPGEVRLQDNLKWYRGEHDTQGSGSNGDGSGQDARQAGSGEDAASGVELSGGGASLNAGAGGQMGSAE